MSLDGIRRIPQKESIQKKEKKETFSFSFFSSPSKKRKRFFTFFSLLIVGGIFTFFTFHNIETIESATYGWIQGDWSGGETTDTIEHPTNQYGWDKYESQNNIEASSSLSLFRESN